MANVFEIKYQVDSTAITKTNHELKKMVDINGKVEQSVIRVDKATSKQTNNKIASVIQQNITAKNREIEATARMVNSLNTASGASRRFERDLKTLNKALELGVIKTHEYEEAHLFLTRRLMAEQKQVTALTGRTRLARHEIVNLGYQVQDIGVSLASGQNPFTVMIQQGSQIAGIMASAGLGVRALASALWGMLKPVAKLAVPLGVVTAGLFEFKSRINDRNDLDAYARSLAMTVKEFSKFEEEVEKIGGTSVGVTEIIKAFGIEFGKVLGLDVPSFTSKIKKATSALWDYGKSLMVSTVALAKAGVGWLKAKMGGADITFMEELNFQFEQINKGINEFAQKVEATAVGLKKAKIKELVEEITEEGRLRRSNELIKLLGENVKKLLSAGKAITDEWMSPAEVTIRGFNEKIETMNELFRRGYINADQFSEAILKLNRELDYALNGNQAIQQSIIAQDKDLKKFLSTQDKLTTLTGKLGAIGDKNKIQSVTDQFHELRSELNALAKELPAETLENLTAQIEALFKIEMEKAQFEMIAGNINKVTDGLESLKSIAKDGSREYQLLAIAIDAMNVVSATHAVLNQGAGDPYTAFARMATMASAVASLGYAVGSFSGGGGSTMNAQANQSVQGIGTVLGNPTAQSESIVKAVETTADASEALVGINSAMLTAIHGLSQAIQGTATVIARNLDVAGMNSTFGQGSSGVGSMTGALVGGAVGYSSMAGAFAMSNPALAGIAIAMTLAGFSIGKELGKLIEGTFIESMMENIVKGLDTLTLGTFSSVTNALGLGGKKVSVEGYGIELGRTTLGQILDGVESAWFADDVNRQTFAVAYTWLDNALDQRQELDGEILNQFELIFKSMYDSIKAGAQVLGMDAETAGELLKNTVIEHVNIGLEGLDSDEQIAQIEKVFSSIFDQLTESVLGGFLGQFQRAGEGLSETLARVVTNMEVASLGFERLGQSLGELAGGSVELMVGISSLLVDVVGGYENLISLQGKYMQNFYSEQEQMDILRNDIFRVTSQLGADVPATAYGFRQLVESIQFFDSATNQLNEDNVKIYASLLQISDSVNEYYEMLEENAQKLLDNAMATTDEAYAILDKAISKEKDRIAEIYEMESDRLNGAIEAQSDKLSSMEGIVSSLSGALDSLIGSFDDTTGAVRKQAQAQLANYIAMAKTGTFPNQDDLDRTLETLQRDSKGLFGSFEEYALDYWKTAQDIKLMGELAGEQKSTDEMILGNLEDQLAKLDEWYNAEIDRLDKMLESYQEQIDMVRGNTVALNSVAGAMAVLSSAIQNEFSVSKQTSAYTVGGIVEQASSSGSMIEGIYQSVLGRSADVGGLNFYSSLLEAGTSIDQIRKEIENSPEALGLLDGSHANGLGYVPKDNYIARLHKGERVMTASENRIYSSNNLADIRSEIRLLREEQSSYNSNSLNEQRETRKTIRKWDVDGQPETRNIA